MGRSRAAPSRASAAPARSAPPPAAPRAAPAQQQNHQQHQAPPMMPQRQGMGMMGTIASVAAGSVIGHGISNMMFSRDHPPTEPAQAQAVAQQYGEGACGQQIKSYAKCMEFNQQNSQQCTWAWDMFMQCQDSQPTGNGSA